MKTRQIFGNDLRDWHSHCATATEFRRSQGIVIAHKSPAIIGHRPGFWHLQPHAYVSAKQYFEIVTTFIGLPSLIHC
jgi:hypothetical protein